MLIYISISHPVPQTVTLGYNQTAMLFLRLQLNSNQINETMLTSILVERKSTQTH